MNFNEWFQNFKSILKSKKVPKTFYGSQRQLIQSWMEVIGASFSDGVLFIQNDELLYFNEAAKKLGIISDIVSKNNPLKLSQVKVFENPKVLEAVLKSLSQKEPVEVTILSEERQYYFQLKSTSILKDPLESKIIFVYDLTLLKQDQAARMKSLAHLSHEVRNPVVSLILALRLLKKNVHEFSNPTHQALILGCSNDIDRLRVLLEELIEAFRSGFGNHD